LQMPDDWHNAKTVSQWCEKAREKEIVTVQFDARGRAKTRRKSRENQTFLDIMAQS